MQRQKYDRKIAELQRQMADKIAVNKMQKKNLKKEIQLARNNFLETYQQMHDDHAANLDEKARIQAEKEEADHQRFSDLEAQCNEQLERFQAMITEVYHEHEKLLEKMYGNFEVEKRELED